jgi:uncharacterized delta-60 repeat protein
MKTQMISKILLTLTLPGRVLQNLAKSVTSQKRLALGISLAVFALPASLMAQAGTLDPKFGKGGIVFTANTVANAGALQGDGKILVAGSISTVQNSEQPGLLRYNTNGTLDSGFGAGGKVLMGGNNAGPAFAVTVQTDGKILVAAPANLALTVFRFNNNGSVDSTFGSNGATAIEAAGLFLAPASGGIALEPDGRILVATGHNEGESLRIVARLLANGQLDSTFGSNGVAPTFGGDSVAVVPNSIVPTIVPNGHILVGTGSVTSMYAPNGGVVKGFGIHGQTLGFANDAGGFVVTNNSATGTRIITAGSIFTDLNLMSVNSVSGFLLVSYKIDGTLDNAFGIHGGVTTPFPGNILARAFAVALQTNGDIVAVGQTALTDTGPSDFALVRYNPDGSVDTTFGNSGFVSTPFGTSVAFANTVLIQIDSKIIAVGNSNNGTTLARYLGS